jgi:hypothetical protein
MISDDTTKVVPFLNLFQRKTWAALFWDERMSWDS